MRVITLAGSPRFPSRSSALLVYAREKLNGQDVEVFHWNLHNFAPEDLIYARFDSPALKTFSEQLQDADGLIVATPVYKAAYSGLLKVFLDVLPQTALKGKLVLPLATGGSPHHMLALDYTLRPVLQSLGARHILPGIYATDQGVPLLPEGGYGLTPDIAERLDDAAQLLTTDLRRSAQWAGNHFENIAFTDVRCSV